MEQILRIVCCAAILLVLTACGSGGKTPQTRSAKDESPVTAMLRAHKLEGRVVLVEFGTIGCELSGKGLDMMADWQRRNAIPGLAFLRLEPTRNKETLDNYYAGKSLGFPVVRDTAMVVANALGTTVFPRFALLDKFGHVRFRGSQPAEKDLADWTRRLENEKTDAGPNASLFGSAVLDAPALLAGTRLPALSGRVKSLAEYRGPKGLLLTFVDTKCPFSASASKEMPAVASALAGRGIATVLVSIGDPEAEVRKSYGANLPGMQVVYDNGKQTQQNWSVQFVPLVVLLDTAGQVIYRGSPVWADVASSLAKRLNLPAGSVRLDAQGTTQG
jgi:peroxiredoxin